VQYLQTGLDLIQPHYFDHFRWYGRVKVEQQWVTLNEKIAAIRASIDWAEEQLALTRSWRSENGWSVAKPDDWIFILDEFEDDLDRLLSIKQDRKAKGKVCA
jgi:hypothetical protein